MMIDFEYANRIYCAHQQTINLIKAGDNCRNGIQCPKDMLKAFSLYKEVEEILNSFEGRCAGLSPYIHMRMCECYLYGIGTDKNLINAFESFVRYVHYLHHLPFVAKIYSAETDPNFQELKQVAKKLLSNINNEFKKHGFWVCLDNCSLRVFSEFRVPFQINQDRKSNYILLKTVIRTALVYFPHLVKNSVLHARYGTTDTKKAFYDLENILFYNLNLETGESLKEIRKICFSKIPECKIKNQQIIDSVPNKFCHYYEYFADSATYEQEQNEISVARWEQLQFSPVRSTSGVFEYWKAIKTSSNQIEHWDSVNTNQKEQFSLYLEIETPKNKEVRILSVLKPLLDAIISAFHGGDFFEEQVQFFAEQLNVPDNWIINNTTNILGKRQYIQRYPSKSGIKWNPADDLCSKVSISVVSGNDWKISGQIYKYI